ncbi:hypothetical protein LSTR_LSTR015338 [Laodelphax striatellus]|uniref:C2H2-type domain-containing protein n=1 Tax=Laodelphax striatellus TaxID=195883 RepID=A0A482WUK4_LAOST|nr:hypothetical protein LSTR_LSTR015338 [Laodelphax striatellus]
MTNGPCAFPIGESSGSSSEEETGSTSGCKLSEELGCEAEKEIQERKEEPDSPMSVENEEAMATGDEDEEEECVPEEGISKTREEARRQRQDAENNNSIGEGEADVDADADADADSLAGDMAGLGFQGLGGFPVPAVPGHVTLEALQNTKVAVAQFAATAMANNADNPAALQNLAVLHSTIYTLQTQQMMQLRLIQQLQQQLQDNGGLPPLVKEPSPPTTPQPLTADTSSASPLAAATTAAVKHQPNTSSAIVVGASVPSSTPPATQSIPPSSHSQALTPTSTKPPTPKPAPTSPPAQPASLPPCSISSSFASSIITNYDPPPSPNGPNSLEMLKRRTEDMLDNASQSLLANNNMADEVAFKKRAAYDSKSGVQLSLKHCCRYCGKVFGSDSALQIHIRSHTGERPFKCNVCGSRFTTKGNLKVHFQRHTSKFPHIKMNPNPVPEHLDKYHPPLIAQMGAHQSLPPGAPPHHPHQIPRPPFPNSPPFPPASLPMYRPPQPPPHDLLLPPHHRPQDPPLVKPILPLSLYSPRGEQEMPENLSKPANSSSPPVSESGDRFKRENIDEEMRSKSESGDLPHANSRLSPKQELEAEGESEHDPDNERYPSPSPYDDCSLDSKYSNEDLLTREDSPSKEENDDSMQEQPQNLSNKMNGEKSPAGSRGLDSPSGSEGQLTPSPHPSHPVQIPRSAQRPPSPAPSESNSLGALDLTPRAHSVHSTPGVSPAPPAATAPPPHFSSFGLLPPVCASSPLMTSALSTLTSSVLNSTAFSPIGLAVGPGVRGNTTCNLCFKTFACNSALEIHYRSHTKERPFKCTICDRGFSTKGNMKQHMLTHKIRDMPPHLFEGHKSGGASSQMCSDEASSNASSEGLLRPMSVEPPLSLPPAPGLASSPGVASIKPEPSAIKRSRSPLLEEPALTLPKRQPSLPKHLCHVCNKNFSSSSALQIHMRTHTGDKPFRCTICHKAFTTKGNLKVHMGTHMWTNGASRRGRRMSLDLPPLPKDSDFLHRRPDLFYPYLPAPFLNGMQQKLNEISVIQNVNSNVGNGLLSFGGYGGGGGGGGGGSLGAADMKPSSPMSDKQPMTSPNTPPLWDLHYDRKPPPSEPSPPPAAPSHVPRGEGLAA